MTTFIDVSSVLMGCGPFTNLVTRSTGAAVRSQIEARLPRDGGTLTVIDFSQVELLDFSCADEVVAKLLLACLDRADGTYFLFRGITESHLDAIDAVLERHGLALVVQLADGAAQLHGIVKPDERRAWDALNGLARACAADEVASAIGLDADGSRHLLDGLHRRRVVVRDRQGRYAALGRTA